MDKVNGKMTGKENIVTSETHQGDYLDYTKNCVNQQEKCKTFQGTNCKESKKNPKDNKPIKKTN